MLHDRWDGGEGDTVCCFACTQCERSGSSEYGLHDFVDTKEELK